MPKFSRLQLHSWRQLSSVDITFHPHLTVITGANGAGKSTILNLCSQHFGISRPFLSTPKKRKDGQRFYDLGYSADQYSYITPTTKIYSDTIIKSSDDYLEDSEIEDLPPVSDGTFQEIGTLTYDNGITTPIGFPQNQANAYSLTILQQQNVEGVPISSHRIMSPYQPVQNLPLTPITMAGAYGTFFSEYVSRVQGGHTQYTPFYRMKETLIAMAAFGEGNNSIEASPDLLSAYNGFIEILRKVLPKEIGFQKLVVRLPDIVMHTQSGEFIIDSSSGGVTAILEIAWQLYLYSLMRESFVVTLDEPENHLHPSMQRYILTNLVETFPNVQFIVATHSPFIVSAVEDSAVYALRYLGATNEVGFPTSGARRVQSVLLDSTAKSGTADDILEDVLGVSKSLPGWASRKLDALVAQLEGTTLSPDVLRDIRAQLAELGLAKSYADVLGQVINDQTNQGS